MRYDLTLAAKAVDQLIEVIDQHNSDMWHAGMNRSRFTIERIEIKVDRLSERWCVAAFDVNDKPFKYAMFFDNYNIDADGY